MDVERINDLKKISNIRKEVKSLSIENLIKNRNKAEEITLSGEVGNLIILNIINEEILNRKIKILEYKINNLTTEDIEYYDEYNNEGYLNLNELLIRIK